MKVFYFGDIRYEVEKELYRSKGSQNQCLYDYEPDEYEKRRKFYVVKTMNKNNPERKYFVKEYTDKNYGSGTLDFPKNISYELAMTKKLHGSVSTSLNTDNFTFHIDTVEMIAKEDNRLLMEYIERYHKLGDLWALYEDFGYNFAKCMINALKYWAEKKQVKHYDMCENNTFIMVDGLNIHIKLIDFEYSEDRDILKEEHPFRFNRS